MPHLPPLANRAARPRAIATLYATPESMPLPEASSPSSFPPSPYIVNHKRRGPPCLLKSLSQTDISLGSPEPQSHLVTSRSFSGGDASVVDVAVANGMAGDWAEPKQLHEQGMEEVGEVESENFFDPRDSMSVGSSAGKEEEEVIGRWKDGGCTSGVEYYDAFEEISSEGTIQVPFHNIESELREMKLNVLTEIEKRKQAEETLINLQRYWECLRNQLSLVGITLPELSAITEEEDKDSYIDPTTELQQQVILARVVAESVGRGSARAEVELEMESQVEAKNFEIARLSDRLHYYEAANREMSQRNQEAVERARRLRRRRKRRQRWVWASMGLAVAIGVAATTWSRFQISSILAPPEGHKSDHCEPN